MTTHRRYCFQHPGTWDREGSHAKVATILETACAQYWWYRDPSVEGEPYGRLSLCFTVSGRDQWWAHRRAMRLAVDCYYAVGLLEKDVPEPVWESLEPHTNRGRYRVSSTQ